MDGGRQVKATASSGVKERPTAALEDTPSAERPPETAPADHSAGVSAGIKSSEVSGGPGTPSPQASIGALLVAEGKLDAAALKRAERAQAESGERLDRVLTRLGLVGDRDMAEAMARHLGIGLASASDYPDLPLLDGVLPVRFLKSSHVLPLDENEASVTLAMADPLDRAAAEAVALRTGRRVIASVAVAAELEAALERLYSEGKSSIDQIADTLDRPDEESTDADVQRLRDQASEAPVIRIVNLLISRAVEARASDIHIESSESRLRVRTRIDGVLRDVDAPPAALRAAVISRIKIMARLNIAEHRLPQDGRIKAVVRGKEIDLRVSTLPTLHGEGVVMRILDREGVVLDFESLGFDAQALREYLALLERPNGILLVTGPTGSGKTTSLYTSLTHLNSPEKKIVTVEDPVEYELEGLSQIQVRPKIGLTFAHTLRSILRYDPDIIMIGEIRDLETAQIAVQASLTGHLVLATLHTNTAAASVTRLLDMGVEDYLLTSTVVGIVAQRLVRRLCPDCREAYDALPELAEQIRRSGFDPAEDTDGQADHDDTITLYRPKGCASCSGLGYRGRVGIIEILPMNDEIRRLVLRHAEAREVQAAAMTAGMRSMYQDGLVKARLGMTSLEEVMRVISEN
ncbi:type II secretion system ATPase GspE [Pelagibius sp. Alg239-R121]|uniref:type II secretion system ATPase GspE n=1 Tax=Pelagibius sp. Alg239-R121 TaxID=2993448 RepID=UPI0024A6DE2F|nr:type II secretion system ATPase GspE [Pelagibius sp. Alg239-R121]